ncbi:disease resistance protein RUN1-like [Rhodamnia argentea]|uniref:Disease resistance protein RUN1-like n=1 Tax=Rhodamnia argentea TaxID=178133 RepID=A0ABM3H4C1_9MYRT|nr:disease resistance protein RUN1-like [Rhodamnia argentea]
MHRPIFGHSFAVLVAPILLSVLAFYLLNKKKAGVRRNGEDADTGAPGSMTTPTEADCDGSSSLPAETHNGASSPSPTETKSGGSTSSPMATSSGGSSSSPTETKSGGSSPSPTGISKGASSSSPTETNNSASSSSTATTGNHYEVFLSFRGPDTRYSFSDHLYKGLLRAGIVTFRDEEELPQGDDIGPEILAAITKSQILIPILSEGYGTSSWCLNELAQIMKCKNDNGQMVLPVFYKVKPADVGHQIGNFGKAFHEREKRLLERPPFDPTILEKWKKALGEVSTLKGYEADGYEADLVESIVRKVLSELKKKFELHISENLVGIDRHVKEVMEVVDTKKSHATLFLGIHGMGGIGKTTLAKAIYNKISNQYEHRSYIADIRESWKRNGGHYLRNQLIYDISKRKNEVRNEDEGVEYISSKFKGKKVLLLLDDVDDVVQLTHLAGKSVAGNPVAGDRDWFSSESMIIITTRNERILQKFGVDHIYDHKELDYEQSMILFCKHAFRKESPPREFEGLTHEVVSITGGLPLSLEGTGKIEAIDPSEGNLGGDIYTEKLKFLNLTDCQYLENTDFLSAFKSLEVLILTACRRLQQIDSSIGGMKALLHLDLSYCKSLTKLPEEIGELKALKQLFLAETPELSALPESIGSLRNLEILDIEYSGIEELPDEPV